VGRKPRTAEQPQIEATPESEEGNLIKSILKRSLKVEPKVNFIPTGILPFDAIVGGVPVGHITLIGGLPGAGKTLFCLKITATHLREGGAVVYADTEGSTTPQRLETMGVPLDLLDNRLFLRHYIMLEDCLTDIKNLLIRLAESNKEKKKFLIVLDSLSSLLPVKWGEASSSEKGFISDAPIGAFARTGSIFLAGLPSLLLEANAALVITTQMRADISTAGRGAPFKMFKFYALEHLSRLTIQLYTPEAFNPPFISALELEGDEKDKIMALKGAYHKVRIGFKKAQVFASQVAVPPNLDISFFYPIVEVPQLGLRAGDVDNIYHVLVYGVITEVLYKEVKPGLGTVFYFPVDNERVVRFSYLDAYKKPKLRELLLTVAAERIKQKISQLLTAGTKGREIFREEEDEDEEIESEPTSTVEELDSEEED
jgi:RecA/RadA recombinase